MHEQTPRSKSKSEAAAPVLRAALYLRVSTGRQAEHDLSIPDQRGQTVAWVAARGWTLEAQFVEPGASATDDKRPEFQRMIERACNGDHPFDVIVVHSYSRFFRDAFGLEFYVRKLAKHGVKLVSMTQELGDDPAQVMMRQVISLFDEYQSKENAKHVLRSMKENARQGFWNGSKPPFGYRTVEAERRGMKVKKKLEIDFVEAEQVELIFKLLVGGYEGQAPMGVKAVANWLNGKGYRTRQGGMWSMGSLYQLLTNPVYGGRWRFNHVDSRTRQRKADAEQIFSDAPAIIPPEQFEQVQKLLKDRNPRVAPPRAVTGPILLSGLAFCSLCQGAMSLRTGTSKSGKVHRYYGCSTCARKGKAACPGRTVQMDKLDHLVTRHLMERLLTGDRIWELLSTLANRRAERAAAVDSRLAALEREATSAEQKLKRLYKLIEDGVAEMDDLLKERIITLKTDRDRSREAFSRAKSNVKAKSELTEEAVTKFRELMRQKLQEGDTHARKAWLASVVDRIEVDEGAIRLYGRKDVLEQCVISGAAGSQGVRTFVPRWRTR
ncbi:MAG: recombinase family protein [Hyphomicrobiaceae bacterium]